VVEVVLACQGLPDMRQSVWFFHQACSPEPSNDDLSSKSPLFHVCVVHSLVPISMTCG
jgi:hypothetical protein